MGKRRLYSANAPVHLLDLQCGEESKAAAMLADEGHILLAHFHVAAVLSGQRLQRLSLHIKQQTVQRN